MIPSREKAEQLLQEGLQKNPGPWGDHSKTAAHCAEKIAAACGDLDPEKAYVLGLLHDIGRTFGVRHLGHVSDGYSYMKKIGCDEVAKVCLTHSFATQTLEEYIGKYDVSEDELSLIRTELEKSVYDDYDRLVQLCDSIAGAEGVLDIEERMLDVKRRYGSAEKMGRAYRTAAVFRRKNGAGCLRGLRKGNLRSEKVLNGQQPWEKILRPGIKIFFRRICVYNLPAACRY